MILSTRLRYVAAVGTTVVGIALIAIYAWRSFSDVSAELGNLSEQLQRVVTIEHIEAELHELGARSPKANVQQLDRLLAQLRERAQADQDSALVATLESRITAARAAGTSEAWSEAAEVVSQIVKVELDQMKTRIENTEDPAKSGARITLRLGAITVLLFGVLALFTFMRYRRETAEAKERLRKADRLAALGTMAASVAHEINNPLATISGCATAVKDRLLRNRTGHEDSIEYLGMIEGETTRCSGIVRQLGDLSRDAPLTMAPTDISRLADEITSFLQFNRTGAQVVVDVQAQEDVVAVCDPDKVKQLLLNLIVNARDAAGEGGTVRVTIQRAGPDSVRLEVADNGVGIAPSELARVFEPFHTTKTRGLGLGLFLCERIVTMHGGRIHAESEGKGHGAKFIVDLPSRMTAEV